MWVLISYRPMVDNLESIVNKLSVQDGEVLAVIHPKIAQAVHDGIRLATTGDPSLMGPEVKPRLYEEKYMVVDHPDEESLIPVSTDVSGKPTNKYPNRLAGEMIYGFFGEIGYVDMIQQRGSPRLIGIVHVPRRLVYLIGAMEGDIGLERFYKEFCKETEGARWREYRWNLQSHPTEFNPDVIKGLPIEGEQYFWKIEKAESDMFKDVRALPEQIATYEATVRNFIIRLDNHVWRMRPGAAPDEVITPEMARDRFAAIQRGTVKYLSTEDFAPSQG